ncbi:MAG: methyltransferase [Alphaproteobacteria bacterium]|nr:methyltransferase [Alphaproteobacteria bacterium]
MKQNQSFFTALDGRVKFIRGNYNITSDAVWLSAFAAGRGGATVLDAGTGTGGAALCLLHHCPDAIVTGIDISEQMLAECTQNAMLNNRKIELIHSDLLTWKTNRTFDTVITNPPYFKGTPRKQNVHHNVNLYDWTRACLRRVKPRGYFYCIVDATIIAEIISALNAGRASDITIVPLFGNKDSAERALVSACLGTRGGTKILRGFDMNDNGVLRDGKIIIT